ncbi:MAG TPA: DUF1648 domain-containing protein [Terriglobales bacterium]
MNRRRLRMFTWLLWLALPLMALRHWQVWDRLPLSMATHFSAANQANGWMPRTTAFWFDMGLLAFMLTIFTAIGYLSQRNLSVTATSWALLLFFYGVIGSVCYIEEAILEYNLYGRTINSGVFGITIAVLAVGLIAALIGFHRGQPLPASDLISEEVQRGKGWVLIVLVALIPFLLILATAPAGALRFAMACFALLILVTAAAAWDGFHYLFTRHGLEIRTLGFRLKSLPRQQIKTYSVSRWGKFGGYGIRGMGGRVAYVWTNRGVRIDTQDGFVFLGHNEPERIVRELDAMMKVAH